MSRFKLPKTKRESIISPVKTFANQNANTFHKLNFASVRWGRGNSLTYLLMNSLRINYSYSFLLSLLFSFTSFSCTSLPTDIKHVLAVQCFIMFNRAAQSKVNNRKQTVIKTWIHQLCLVKNKTLGAPLFENTHDIKSFPAQQTEQTLDKQCQPQSPPVSNCTGIISVYICDVI